MPIITFNAFSFLQKKLKEKNVEFSNVQMEIDQDICVTDLVHQVGLNNDEVEVAFVNGKVKPLNTRLKDGDRVALVPPGTPGPYRVLLGFKNKQNP